MKTLYGLAPLLLAAALPLQANAAQSARPLFLSVKHSAPAKETAAQLPQWNGSFVDRTGKQVNFTMVGGDPSKGGATHVSVVLVPVIAVYDDNNGNKTFNPLKHKVANGQTVVENIVNSPLFTSSIDYIQGGTDLGTTQFIDAFQRGNFWKTVKQHPDYSLVYDVAVGNPLKIGVSHDQGSVIDNPLGRGKVGTFGFALFDQYAQSFVASHADGIAPGAIPLFVTYNVYLTEGGCCIGGYHYAAGDAPSGQTYAFATYVDAKKSFAEDVSAIALELGEVTDDPFNSNMVNCADTPFLSAGATVGLKNVYPYTENNYTYHLPSLDFVTYFGAPKSTSVNKWYSFQGEQRHVCGGQ